MTTNDPGPSGHYPSGQPYSQPPIWHPDDSEDHRVDGVFLQAADRGSPHWLRIVRDVLVSLFCLLASLAVIFTAVALYQAGDALGDITDGGSTPTTAPCYIPDDPTCVAPGD